MAALSEHHRFRIELSAMVGAIISEKRDSIVDAERDVILSDADASESA
jgi:hypothetical protein